MKIGNQYFDTENECYIMGILNVTPDSFFRWGKVEQYGQGKKTCGRYDPGRGGDH